MFVEESPANRIRSRFIDKAYIGDTEGNLWRFDTFAQGGVATLSIPIRKHDAGMVQPLYGSLATHNAGGATQYVYMSTGLDLLPVVDKVEDFALIGLSDLLASGQSAQMEFQYTLNRHAGTDGDERSSSSPAVAGDVVFFTTTTEFPLDPCRCHETALYTLTTDGDEAYTTGGGAPTGGNTTVEEVATWEGRATAPFIADQHVYVGVDDDLRVLGDPDDFNNGASTESVRITSWREIR